MSENRNIIFLSRIRPAASLAFAGLMVLMLGGLGFTPSCAKAATATGAPVFGSVDIQKVLNGYREKSTAEADFQHVVNQYQAAIKVQGANGMLSQSDQSQLGLLLLKTTTTPADDSEIKTLEAKSQADENELTALQQKSNLTDADKARLSQLTQEQQNGQTALQSISDGYKQTLDERQQTASEKIADEVRVAVASVAQSKGLTVVFDSSLAIYAQNDVTAAVLAKLNASADGGK